MNLKLPLIAWLSAISLFQVHAQVYERIFDFSAANKRDRPFVGKAPNSPLLLATDGNIYGMTGEGGALEKGTVFKVSGDGVISTVAQFSDPLSDADAPSGGLVERAGVYYGVRNTGGSKSLGSIFKLTQNGVLTTLVEFTGNGTKNRGSNPQHTLTLAADGNFYGTTTHGGINGSAISASDGNGTIFRVTPGGTLTTLVEFTGAGASNRGRYPSSDLIIGADGNFYGTTSSGGVDDKGTIFRMTPSGVETLHEFTTAGGKGTEPSNLMMAGDGSFYGSVSDGIFRMMIDTSGGATINKIVSLDGSPSSLLQASNENFYGTTNTGGGSGEAGSVFRLSFSAEKGWEILRLHSFGEDETVGRGGNPRSGLIMGADGNLYGTTSAGGMGNSGTIFKLPLEENGVLTYIGAFPSTESPFGREPSAELTLVDGFYYGVTERGGSEDKGTIFRISESGEHTVLVHFTGTQGDRQGSRPTSKLLYVEQDGYFYGTTDKGGADSEGRILDYGTIFRMKLPDNSTALVEFETLVKFEANSDTNKGRLPSGDLILVGEFLYGTTRYLTEGSSVNGGTVFRLERTPGTNVQTLATGISVSKGVGKISEPISVVNGNNGFLYGTSHRGGIDGLGTVFRLKISNVSSVTPEVLKEFTINDPGSYPSAGLILAKDLNFYGMTRNFRNGLASDSGTAFRITPQGQLTTLHPFVRDIAGSDPVAGLIENGQGTFYGTTSNGGEAGGGTVFKMTQNGDLNVVANFEVGRNAYPKAGLIAANGNLMGTAYGDPASGDDGGIYRMVFPGSPTVATLAHTTKSISQVMIECLVNPRGSPTSVWVDYGTDQGNLTNSIPLAVNLNGFVSKRTGTLLSGLAEKTTYYYRFRASSGAIAEPTVSSVLSFSTFAAPLATVTEATQITRVSARLNGMVNANGFNSSILFEWGTDGNLFPNRVLASPPSDSGSTPIPVSYLLPGLSSGQTIFYRIVAINAGGTTTSGTQSFRTLVPATATVTGATALSTTRAQITGTVDAKGSRANVSFQYGTKDPVTQKIILNSNKVTASPSSVSGESPKEVTGTLTGLTQGTTYHVRILAPGPGGNTPSEFFPFSLGILSGLAQVFPNLPPLSDGSVTVNFSPPTTGAWRFAGDTEWLTSGQPYGNLAAGQRVIEFLPIPGFISPPSETLDVSGSASLTLGRIYYVTPTAGTGSLKVQLKPDEISGTEVPDADRAQWRIVGEAAWRDDNTTHPNLVAGSYLVECKPLEPEAGRETPPPIPVFIAAGEQREITLTYFTSNTLIGSPPLPQPFASVFASEDTPFAHVGQIRTDVGSSTGFVVKRRVVATAGHVVFDDGKLSIVTGMRWYFQRHRGQYEPRPQRPRGSYIATKYEEQRRVDNSPGEGSAQSQALDYAALYFTDEDAGRGGHGGYFASDSGDENEFLISTADKILAGFPMSGIPKEDSGKLHATAAFTTALSPASGGTWTTTAVRGLGGMSGGPLFVRHTTGAFFPAAIYLGGSGQTVVRAIDSAVVDLFLRAEVSGNGGGNNTNGGVTQTSLTGNLNTTQPGALKVIIEPVAARNVGAGWLLSPETAFRESNDQASGLDPGNYSLIFNTIPGFATPTSQLATVNGGQLTTITYTYPTPLESWRFDNFGTMENTGDAADGNDFDKDDETNLEEFTAGTDPKNGNDFLKIATATKSGNTFIATCDGKTGRTYTLLRSTTLDGTWTRLDSKVAADGTVTLSDTSAPTDKSFYRIEVSMP